MCALKTRRSFGCLEPLMSAIIVSSSDGYILVSIITFKKTLPFFIYAFKRSLASYDKAIAQGFKV